MDQSFLFVNYDAKTLVSRNDIQLINTHVQKYCRKRRRRTTRELPRYSLPLDGLRIVPGQNEAEAYHSSALDPSNRPARAVHPSVSNIQIIGRSIDHFSSLTSSECFWLIETLDYFFSRYAASQMPVDLGNPQRTATIQSFFSVAVGNPAVFHAFMAKTRCDFDAYLGKSSHANPSPQVLYHRGQALKSLPNQMKDGRVEYGCVIAIILLMTVDTAYCDVKSLLMHRQGLRHIVNTESLNKKKVYLPLLRGSYLDEGAADTQDSFSSWLEGKDLYDYVTSFTSSSVYGLRDIGSQSSDMSRDLPAWSLYPETQFSSGVQNRIHLTYPAHPFSTELHSLIAQLPIGFRRVALKRAISIESLNIIRRVSEIQTILAKTASKSATVPELNFLHRYQPQSEFQEGFDCLRRLQTKPVTLEHCLCLAAMVFTNLKFNVMRFGSLWQRMRERLTSAVLECTASIFEMNCLFWTMSIVVWSWEGRLGLEEPGQRVLEIMLAQYPITRNLDGMKEILRDFFWTDELGRYLQRYGKESNGVRSESTAGHE